MAVICRRLYMFSILLYICICCYRCYLIKTLINHSNGFNASKFDRIFDGRYCRNRVLQYWYVNNKKYQQATILYWSVLFCHISKIIIHDVGCSVVCSKIVLFIQTSHVKMRLLILLHSLADDNYQQWWTNHKQF